MSEKVKAKIQFIGMEKLIEIPPGTKNYKIALPVHVADASIIYRTGEEPTAEQARYVSLVFTAEPNPRYGQPGETEICFIFDHVDMEGLSEKQDKRKKVEKIQKWPTMKPKYIIEQNNAKIIDDPIREITYEQRALVIEWYRNHKSYFEVTK